MELTALKQSLADLIVRPTGHQLSDQAADYADLFALAHSEGMESLLFRNLSAPDPENQIWNQFKLTALRQTAASLLLQKERLTVLEGLARFAPVVLKGQALASTLYDDYSLRPMGDMDLIVDSVDLQKVQTVMLQLGYKKVVSNSAELIMPQENFVKKLSDNLVSVVDIHTALFNRPSIQELLGYDELIAAAVSHQAFPRGVVVPSTADLTIHAALHLLAHHFNSRKLIWLYDIHLLVNALDNANQHRLLAFCKQQRLAKAVLSAIQASAAVFPSQSEFVVEELTQQAQEQIPQHPATELLTAHTQLNVSRSDWRLLPDWNARLHWIRQHLFPSAQYVQNHYKVASKWQIPLFYLWRILRGGVKLIRPNSHK